MEFLLQTKNLVFNITKHNPEHPIIKNEISFEMGDFYTDLKYSHTKINHRIEIKNHFTEWQLIDLTNSSVLYNGDIIATLVDNIQDPEPYNDDGFLDLDGDSLSGHEIIHLDNGVYLNLTKNDITINLPIDHYDIEYFLRGKIDNPFDMPTIKYIPIEECINHFFNNHSVFPLNFPSFSNSDAFGSLADPFGRFDPFNENNPFGNIDRDDANTTTWVLNTKYKLTGLDEFVNIHEFLTDDDGNKVWIPQDLGCWQLSTIKLALNIPDLTLGQEIGLDEILNSQHGSGITNIVTPTKAITIRLEHDIPRLTIWIDKPQY